VCGLSERSLENLPYKQLLAYFVSVVREVAQKLRRKADTAASVVLKGLAVDYKD